MNWLQQILNNSLVVVECPNNPPVPNATYRIQATPQSEGKPKAYGNIWEFSCNSGFRLAGNPIVTCQANKTWTSPPVCIGK